MQSNRLDRRTAIRGAAVVAAGATLAACGSTDSTAGAASSSATPTLDAGTTFDAIGSASAPVTTGVTVSGAAAAENGIGSTSGVAVGGGAVFETAKVVVTQPTAGSYKAFTAVCTHQGCLVAGVANGAISCPCHGSSFSIKDGSVLNGPATQPLKEEKITVSGTTIKLG
jgi:Rieske Fe-S protein